jgi:hypothetical protein
VLARPACLASAQAFVDAPPDQLAAAVLFVGFGDTFATELAPQIGAHDVHHRIAVELALAPEHEPMSYRWLVRVAQPDLLGYELVTREGIIHAEQRLLLWRQAPPGDRSGVVLTLLRRGRAVLASGDVATYLG